MTKVIYLEVAYSVTGTDHDGYCSGEENLEIEPDREDIFRFTTTDEYFEKHLKDDTDKFNFTLEGCSSQNLGAGSGYCNGEAEQTYTFKSYKILDSPFVPGCNGKLIFYDNEIIGIHYHYNSRPPNTDPDITAMYDFILSHPTCDF
jgi:hypothetical protein